MNANNEVNKITSWLINEVKSSGTKGLIVGISGGIDSAVVTHIIKNTNLPCLGVIMPCDSNPNDKEDALKVVQTSNINYIEFDLTDTFNLFKKNLKSNGVSNKLSLSNTKARLRMSTLYAFAQEHNYLVVGTDNACEWHIGYFTKYGDGGIDLVPIIEYTKTEVRELARELGVHDDIITKKPSAGLWENQTDEDEIGLSYDIIDSYLMGNDVSYDDKKIIEDLHRKSEHKRHLARGYKREQN